MRKNIIYDGTKRLLLNIRWDQKLQNDLKRRAKVLSMSMEVMNAYTWFYEPSKQRVSFGEGFDKIGRNALDINSFEKFAECVHLMIGNGLSIQWMRCSNRIAANGI